MVVLCKKKAKKSDVYFFWFVFVYFVLFNLLKSVAVARGAWFSEVCSGRKTQETAVSKWVKCKMRNTCV